MNSAKNNSKYLCIHGHFYQPPRENPWIEEIEVQDSAAPYHDWNERISVECYRPNTAARLVNDKNQIISIVNNYSKLSFNIGPTLLSWIKKKQEDVYREIIKADKISKEKNRGHGNAMAQVYNHMIMPLANTADKVTQVRWGIQDFLFHFGRKPEGMWLAETAVDLETLSVLADHGIRFTILSPFQARRFRKSPADEWEDVSGGKIDTARPYLCRLPDGKSIYLFFYNANIARGVAFENLLRDSKSLVVAIKNNCPADRRPCLVHYATDGESYGHHFKFGEMALAAAFDKIEREKEFTITNYANYLDLFGVDAEVEIIERSSWSCAHGVERWRADCGCRIGGHPNWNQKWRAPLREGLDRLRDRLAELYLEKLSPLVEDAWEVRNRYIDVLLNSGAETRFFNENFKKDLTPEEKVQVLQLLEMQRYSMLMFTSCGWFFDEISGLETVQIMSYAARAIQLAEEMGASKHIEEEFLSYLERAPSNKPQFQNGLGVYNQLVRPEITTQAKLVAHYGISLSATKQKQEKLFCYRFAHLDYQPISEYPASCFVANIRSRDERTKKEEEFVLSVVHFGGLDFRCSVKAISSVEEYHEIKNTLRETLRGHSTSELIHFLDQHFGRQYYTLGDCFLDERRELAMRMSERSVRDFLDFHKVYYEENKHLMLFLQKINVPLPDDFMLSAKKALSDKLKKEVKEVIDGKDIDFLREIITEAERWHVNLDTSTLELSIGRAFISVLEKCQYSLAENDMNEMVKLMDLCELIGIKPWLWKLQNAFYELDRLRRTGRVRIDERWTGIFTRLERFLNFSLPKEDEGE